MAINQVQSRVNTKLTAAMSSDERTLSRKPRTYLSMAISSLKQDKLTLSALWFVAILGILSLLAPVLSSVFVGVGPNDTNPENQFSQPYVVPYIQWRLGQDMITAPTLLYESDGVTHWLGTDQLGRDQLVRLLYGGRVSLAIAFLAAFISLIIGVFLGTIAGFFGGIIDDAIMWLINTLSSIPGIYLLIIVTAIFSPSWIILTLFLGLLGWLGTARFMRGNVFKVRELDYTVAARAIGAKNLRIMAYHIIPNSIAIILVITAGAVGALILTESALSFLGLGVQPPTATWGSMLSRANNYFYLRDDVGGYAALHLLLPPGFLITLTVLAFFIIGDGLRDALDPMLKNKR